MQVLSQPSAALLGDAMAARIVFPLRCIRPGNGVAECRIYNGCHQLTLSRVGCLDCPETETAQLEVLAGVPRRECLERHRRRIPANGNYEVRGQARGVELTREIDSNNPPFRPPANVPASRAARVFFVVPTNRKLHEREKRAFVFVLASTNSIA